MKEIILILVTFFVTTIFVGCTSMFLPKEPPTDGSIWFPNGSKQSIHRRLGLAGREQLPLSTILSHASNLGYEIEEQPPEANDGIVTYKIDTMLSKNKSSWLIYFLKINDDGNVHSIVEFPFSPATLGFYTNFMDSLSAECAGCDETASNESLAMSRYANSGPINLEFPQGKEKRIRFHLGLADVTSIHVDAVRSHAEALGYNVSSFQSSNNATDWSVLVIESSKTSSRQSNQIFEVRFGLNGWVQSVIEVGR